MQEHLTVVSHLASALAELDVLANLSERAETFSWNCPELSQQAGLTIQSGRHPVIEQLAKEHFIANDLCLEPTHNILLITGPNM